MVSGLILLWLLAAVGASVTVFFALNATLDSTLRESAQQLLILAVSDEGDEDDSEEASEEDFDHPPYRDGAHADRKTRSRIEQDRRLPRLSFDSPRVVGDDIRFRPHRERLVYLIQDRQGRVLLRSHTAHPRLFSISEEDGFSRTATSRLYAESTADGAYRIQVAESLEGRREAFRQALVWFLAPLMLALPLFGGFVFWVVRRRLRPLHALAQEIASRGGAHLQPVSAEHLSPDLRAVAEAVNALLARLSTEMASERAFSSAAAHELRTPVASQLAKIQRLYATDLAPDVRLSLQQMEQALKQWIRVIEKLLQLARAESGIGFHATPMDAGLVLTMVVDELRREWPDHRLMVEQSQDVWLNADVDAFGIILRNLIENAARHGDRETPIRVYLTSQALVIENDSPVLSPAEIDSMTDRFVRGPSSSDEGAGLGLSIVAALCRQLGWVLSVRSPCPGTLRGVHVEIQFKASSTAIE
jgi:two-component system OmpR family sensor kinase